MKEGVKSSGDLVCAVIDLYKYVLGEKILVGI